MRNEEKSIMGDISDKDYDYFEEHPGLNEFVMTLYPGELKIKPSLTARSKKLHKLQPGKVLAVKRRFVWNRTNKTCCGSLQSSL